LSSPLSSYEFLHIFQRIPRERDRERGKWHLDGVGRESANEGRRVESEEAAWWCDGREGVSGGRGRPRGSCRRARREGAAESGMKKVNRKL
jgi:hypothetical protein